MQRLSITRCYDLVMRCCEVIQVRGLEDDPGYACSPGAAQCGDCQPDCLQQPFPTVEVCDVTSAVLSNTSSG